MRHRPAKKSWRQAVDTLRLRHPGLSLGCLSGLFGKSREGYYSVSRSLRAERALFEREIVSTVKSIRQQDPGIGAYKLHLMIRDVFPEGAPGRDRFYRLMHDNHLMLKPHGRRHTTDSNHNYRKYKNMTKGFRPDGMNRLWVADITYIDTDAGVLYLHLLTDAFTHEIIGWTLSRSLMAENTVAALQQGIDSMGRYGLDGLIHHSDRGSQYCCCAYVGLLNSIHATISMTEDYCPTDNAIAERVNGIIKQEWLYRMKRPKDQREAHELISGIIDFYNNKRPHLSNEGKLPPAMLRKTLTQNDRTFVCPPMGGQTNVPSSPCHGKEKSPACEPKQESPTEGVKPLGKQTQTV